MLSNTLRFVLIVVVILVAMLLVLAVGGMLSSDELWSNVKKVGLLGLIAFGASSLLTLIAKK
jgi:hypothetical protein